MNLICFNQKGILGAYNKPDSNFLSGLLISLLFGLILHIGLAYS